LKTALKGLGLKEVVTYPNSENVVFSSGLEAPELSRLLDVEPENRFGQNIPVLVKNLVRNHPDSGSVSAGMEERLKRTNLCGLSFQGVRQTGNYSRSGHKERVSDNQVRP